MLKTYRSVQLSRSISFYYNW